MDKPLLDDLIKKHGLSQKAASVQGLLKEAIRLTGTVTGPNTLSAGTSRLGGTPDLTDGFQWPIWHEKPMSFIAQIRLGDISGFAPASGLPKDGLISFFYDAAQETYGADPADKDGWRVFYFEGAAQLKPGVFPAALPEDARFNPLALTFSSVWTLPSSLKQGAPDQPWTDQDQTNFEALLQDFQGSDGHHVPQHQMFGWPEQIQDDMQLQSAMMSSGITDINDPRTQAAQQARVNWQLLLQVDSDDNAKMRWASYGMIDYWIETPMLKTRQFERTWLVLQSD